jgi:hypothetical protein
VLETSIQAACPASTNYSAAALDLRRSVSHTTNAGQMTSIDIGPLPVFDEVHPMPPVL